MNSQGYLAHVAARAVIVLRADNPVIGEIAVVAVGMSDVSTCVLHPDLSPGQHLTKGDELGHFAFSGSTHCLVLRPGAVDSFALTALPSPVDPDPPWSGSAPHSQTPPDADGDPQTDRETFRGAPCRVPPHNLVGSASPRT